ncbi:hypothetical protein Gotur_032909 [Gossypium turneri]
MYGSMNLFVYIDPVHGLTKMCKSSICPAILVEYEAIASSDSSVNLDDIDNRIITEVLGPERYVQRLRDQMAQMQTSTVEQIAQPKAEAASREAEAERKYEELQLQLKAEAAAREAEANRNMRTPATASKYDEDVSVVAESAILDICFLITPNQSSTRKSEKNGVFWRCLATEDGGVHRWRPKCGNINWHIREVVYEHLIVDGFIQGEDDMEGMLRDAVNMRSHGLQSFPLEIIAFDNCDIGGDAFTETGINVLDEESNGEATKFYKLLNKMNEELYEG